MRYPDGRETIVDKRAYITLISYAGPVLCLFALAAVRRAAQFARFQFLAIFLALRLLTDAALLSLIHYGQGRIDTNTIYKVYFLVYWLGYALQAATGLGIIYNVYRLAMAPLAGLQRLGTLMFRWAACIATAISLAIAVGPHASGQSFIIRAVSQLQQTVSVLTLCMLLFVCLAIRPMGLSQRSRIFGVSLGLGVLACADLLSSAWVALNRPFTPTIEIANGLAFCCAISIWIGYFAVAEPKRQLIVLPTTSPFLRWNQISLALGDQPGFVAIGEVGIDMFAPAEVEVMRRASLKMKTALSS